MSVIGRFHSVETFGAVDGPGIRYVVFLQGCPLRCLYCHNPDSWKFDGGIKISSDKIVGDIERYRNFIKRGGVTISGGEPLAQPDFTKDIIIGCKKLGLHTAIDTAGSIEIEKSAPVIDKADMLLLDVKTADFKIFKELTGVEADNLIDTLDYCEKTNKRIWVRHVLVPKITLVDERLYQLAEFLSQYSCIERIELLPFHKMGEFKWKNLGYEYKLYDIPTPKKEEIDKAVQILHQKGLNIIVK